MKVTSPHHPTTAAAGSPRKPAAAGERFTVAADTAPAQQEAPATAKNAAAHAGKGVPPGLEKVQARLQALAAGNPTRGQSNALSVINRNIARYAEQQAAADTATPPAATDDAAPTDTAPVATAPTETPTGSEPPAATTDTPPQASAPGDTPAAGDATLAPDAAATPATAAANDPSAIGDTTTANTAAAAAETDPAAPATGTA